MQVKRLPLERALREDAAVPSFELPHNLLWALDDDEDAAPARRAWMAKLPSIVAELARRWSLDVGRPFDPGGSSSWVAPVERAGERLVLKVGWPHFEALHEADGLRAWQGAGAVRLLDADWVGDTRALLIERCEPGTALSRLLAPREQDEVVARLLRRLWVDPPANHRLRTLQSMCDAWADGFEARYAAAAAGGLRLDPGLARAGAQLLRELPAGAERSVLLCTDLHAGNVLAARREPWLLIDPKPYVGDPAYDALQHMLNCPPRLAADPVGLVRRMAALLDLDAERLRRWLFARAVQESVGRPDLRDVALALAP